MQKGKLSTCNKIKRINHNSYDGYPFAKVKIKGGKNNQ